MQTPEQLLQSKSIRPTAMRLLLVEYFLQYDRQSLSLNELEIAFPKSDRITIYRTLKTFEEKGILHAIEQATGGSKYALCEEHCSPGQHRDQHPHFQCTVCNQLQCLEDQSIPEVEIPKGYQAQEISMTIKGICPSCQQASKSNK